PDVCTARRLQPREVQAGALKLNQERTRPITLTLESFNRHAPEAEVKRIRIEHKTYPDLSAVMADRRALRSIFDNLLSNAIEFTREDGRIELGALEKENFVVFYVRDSGPGIRPERLPRIFSRFATDRTDGNGTGH